RPQFGRAEKQTETGGQDFGFAVVHFLLLSFIWGLAFAAGFGAVCVLGFVENKTVLRRLGRIVRHSQGFDKGRQFSLHLGRLKTVFPDWNAQPSLPILNIKRKS
ncbi:TPA: hypothetical protein ACFP4Y_001366, partial [Neisseria bacilliformis]